MDVTILKLTCPDAVGLLARVTGFIASAGGNLLDVSQYTDPVAKWFFARLAFEGGLRTENTVPFRAEVKALMREMRAEWTLRPARRPIRTAILVSRADHCLWDLLWRWRSGELNMEVPVVLSNHPDCRTVVEREGIPLGSPLIPSDKPAVEADEYRRSGRSKRFSEWGDSGTFARHFCYLLLPSVTSNSLLLVRLDTGIDPLQVRPSQIFERLERFDSQTCG